MAFLDSSIRVRHECLFCEFSERFPEVKMALWCMNTNEMLYINARSREEAEAAMNVAKDLLEVGEAFIDGSSAVATMNICSCSDRESIDSLAHACNCWVIPPITYYRGWEHYRMFSPNKAALRKFIQKVEKKGEVVLLSTKGRESLDLMLDIGITPVHLFDGLSDRQLRVLTLAYETGLLDVPARVEMDEVAKRENISRSTYGEHLRKSIRQVVENSYPLLKPYTTKKRGE